jgi:two-component system response regulator HydG
MGVKLEVCCEVRLDRSVTALSAAEKRAPLGAVLLVDDEPATMNAIRAMLSARSFKPICARSGGEAFEILEAQWSDIDCVLTDLYMAGISGMDLLVHVRQSWPDLPTIMLTGHGDVPSAVSAIRAGAFDFLVKPVNTDALAVAVGRGVEHHRLLSRNRYLEQRLVAAERFKGFVGNSAPMRQVFELVASVAATDATVLVLGESGTGKELVARSLHEHSQRATKSFVAINCGALTETLLESELFGHEKGAFTGADSRRRGLFEEASGGTIFLDEVGELSPSTQVRLLRVLQERHIRPVGSNQARPVDVRVIAATNRDLDLEVREKRFREDLYYRLNVVSIELPPLRSRGDDLLLLAHHLMAKHSGQLNKSVHRLAPEALEALRAYDWPGNVRELENAIERAVILTVADTIQREALPPQLRAGTPRTKVRPNSEMPFAEAKTRFERQYLEQILEESAGNLSLAARRAGMDRSNFRRLLDRHGVREAAGSDAETD